MNKVLRIAILCFISLMLTACDSSKREIKAGRYGMMSDETPQYAALVFIMSIYEEKTLDSAIEMSSDNFARLLRSYHTNNGVQRHVLNLRLDDMTVEPVTGGFRGITEYKTKASVDVKITGTYNYNRLVDLKTISMIKVSGDWKITGVKDTLP